MEVDLYGGENEGAPYNGQFNLWTTKPIIVEECQGGYKQRNGYLISTLLLSSRRLLIQAY